MLTKEIVKIVKLNKASLVFSNTLKNLYPVVFPDLSTAVTHSLIAAVPSLKTDLKLNPINTNTASVIAGKLCK